MTTEATLIEKIRRAIPSRPGGFLRLGIGDDAAVLRGFTRGRPARGVPSDWVFTSDSFLEGVHFLPGRHPARAVGYKALARTLSDIAAMGAVPRVFLLNLAFPQKLTGSWLDQFLGGMARAARNFRVVLAGGDIAQFPFVAISIAVLGEVPTGKAVKRSGARPGDLLLVSGTLGAAQLGLELILRHGKPTGSLLRSPALRTHLFPNPRLELGAWLAGRGLVSAMIDTSDGFSTDLARLCQASRVGVHVWAGRLPGVQVAPGLRRKGFSSLELALYGGEDYELVFAVPSRLARRIPSSHRGVRLTQVGEFVRGREVRLIDSDERASKLAPRGWDHFR